MQVLRTRVEKGVVGPIMASTTAAGDGVSAAEKSRDRRA